MHQAVRSVPELKMPARLAVQGVPQTYTDAPSNRQVSVSGAHTGYVIGIGRLVGGHSVYHEPDFRANKKVPAEVQITGIMSFKPSRKQTPLRKRQV